MRSRRLSGCFWPDRTQRLLLQAALLPGEGAIRAWEACRPDVDLDAAPPEVVDLLPLARRNLTRMDVCHPAWERVRGLQRHTWCQNQLALDHLGRVLSSLHGRGVGTLVVSEVAAGLRYPDLGLRRIGRADVVVSHDVYDKSVVDGTGWEGDLHDGSHAVAGAAEGWVLTTEWLWQGAQPVEVAGAVTAVPGPADQLLLTAMDGAQWKGEASPRWVADAATTVRSAGASLDWERLVEQALRRRGAAPLLRLLRYLEEVLDCPVPSKARRDLESAAGWPDELAYRVRSRSWGRLDGVAWALAGTMRSTERFAGSHRCHDEAVAPPNPSSPR